MWLVDIADSSQPRRMGSLPDCSFHPITRADNIRYAICDNRVWSIDISDRLNLQVTASDLHIVFVI
jgi:hypothetical protein